MTGRPSQPRVLLIVPTHDHASTLDLAVGSALTQTTDDLDVVIIGDGVGDDTRDVVRALCRADERVRFVDRPKSASRAEEVRHEVIAASTATVVTYLGDDDLLLPDHVEAMLELLGDHDFAHPFPIVIDDDNRLVSYPTDLSDPRCVTWHLHPGHNTVSLTGAAHTTKVYNRLPQGWQAPPPNRWSDHFMWEQLFRLPGIRIATARRATTVKPPAALRGHVEPGARREVLQAWWDRAQEPGFSAWWDVEVADAMRRSAVETFMNQSLLDERALELEVYANELHEATERARHEREAEHAARLAELERAHAARIAELETDAAILRGEVATARADLEVVRATRTWRLHDRLARHALIRRLLARRNGSHRR